MCTTRLQQRMRARLSRLLTSDLSGGVGASSRTLMTIRVFELCCCENMTLHLCRCKLDPLGIHYVFLLLFGDEIDDTTTRAPLC